MQRTIVVTGAGRGIGREIALKASRGGDVAIIIDKDGESAKETETFIRQSGFSATAYQADLTSPEQVARVFESVFENNKRIDGLVNNAGYYKLKPVEELDIGFFSLVMDANVKTAFLCSLEAFKYMKMAGYGKIVNITSSTVFTSGPALCPYITSKSALVGLTRSLAMDLSPYNITVNAIAAGLTTTEYAYEAFGAQRFDRLRERKAIKRDQNPVDLLGAVFFLMDPASDFITGQTLSVDGGLTFT